VCSAFASSRCVKFSIGSTADAGALIRCSPKEDATNGFFVSCFVRSNAFDNTKTAGRNYTERETEDTTKRGIQAVEEGARKKQKKCTNEEVTIPLKKKEVSA
jgi:hypothetical protein